MAQTTQNTSFGPIFIVTAFLMYISYITSYRYNKILVGIDKIVERVYVYSVHIVEQFFLSYLIRLDQIPLILSRYYLRDTLWLRYAYLPLSPIMEIRLIQQSRLAPRQNECSSIQNNVRTQVNLYLPQGLGLYLRIDPPIGI